MITMLVPEGKRLLLIELANDLVVNGELDYGKVLVVGGVGGVATVEVYDPLPNSWFLHD